MSYESLRRFATKAPRGFFGQQAAAIGVDFGVASLKVLQIAPAGETSQLVAGASIPTPEDIVTDAPRRLAFQLAELPKILKTGGFKGNRVACSLPAGQTTCKHLTIARPQDGKLDAAVQGAVAAAMGVDPASFVFRYAECGASTGASRLEVLCATAPRTLVDKLVISLTGAKIDVVGMHAEHNALLRALDTASRTSDERSHTVLYADVGAATTKITIARGTTPVFARTLEFGGRELDMLIAKRVGCERSEAHRRRITLDSMHSTSDEAEAGVEVEAYSADDIEEGVGILADEIRMCLRYHESTSGGRRANRAVFVGGESRQHCLCRAVAEALQIPARIADPMSQVQKSGKEPATGVDFARPQPGWTVALGLCLSPMDL